MKSLSLVLTAAALAFAPASFAAETTGTAAGKFAPFFAKNNVPTLLAIGLGAGTALAVGVSGGSDKNNNSTSTATATAPR